MNNNCNPANSFKPFRQTDLFFNQGLNNFWANDSYKDVPSFNIKSDEQSYTIELAAPGLEKSDFNLNIKDDMLNVSVDKAKSPIEENTAIKGKYLKREFGYSNFTRKFKLDKTISIENIEAAYQDGILSITLKKIINPEIIRKIDIV